MDDGNSFKGCFGVLYMMKKFYLFAIPVVLFVALVFPVRVGSQSAPDEEFTSGSLDGYIQYIPKAGPAFTHKTDKWDGYLRISVPSTDIYWHWSTSDQAPQLRRNINSDDWQVETRLQLSTFTDNANFITGLMVYFSETELFYWGFSRGSNTLRMYHSGVGNYMETVYTGGNTVELLIEKEENIYTFSYREEGSDIWSEAGTYYSGTACQAVGLIINTWKAGNAIDADFDYLRFQGDKVLIVSDSLSGGNVGIAYHEQLQAVSGTQPYSWSLSQGTLPNGLTLDTSTGEISGTPTQVENQTFTVQVIDGSTPADTANKVLSIDIQPVPPLTVTNNQLLNGIQDKSYSDTVKVEGGIPPYDWSVSAGSLPDGLVLQSSSGVIEGTPTAEGTYNFTIQIDDDNLLTETTTQSYTVEVFVVDDENPIPPAWIYEPWVWEDVDNNESAVRDLIQGYASRDIPVGGVILDSPWETKYNSFIFDPARYPTPQQLVDDLHAMDIKVITWITSLINEKDLSGSFDGKSPNYDYAKSRGYFLDGGALYQWWKGYGSFIDYTNPEAVAWWHGQMDKVLMMGIDGWKVDAGNRRMPDIASCYTGTISKKDYSTLHYRDFYEYTLQRSGKYAITMNKPYDDNTSDSTYVPLAYSPVNWLGDQQHTWGSDGLVGALNNFYLAANRRFIAIGSDIGGFSGQTAITKELLIRWTQFGAMSPLMENGGLGEHRPWMYDSETETIYRYFAKLHSQLVPYLYSEGVRCHNQGVSLVTPKSGTWQYLLGEDLFVAAIYENTNSRSIAFPTGDNWIDYWNDDNVHAGGSNLSAYNVPLERYPIFIRQGAFIPMNVRDGITGHGSSQSAGYLTMLVYPAPLSGFTLRQEEKADIAFACIQNSDSTQITVSSSSEDYIFKVKYADFPEAVKLNNTPLGERATFAEFELNASGWYHDNNNNYVWIKFSTAGNNVSVVIETGEPPLQITTASLPAGTEGVLYNATVEAEGGQTPYQWDLISGVLPNGLLLDNATGNLSGIPTLAGSYAFTIQVTDSESGTNDRAFTIDIEPQSLIDEEFTQQHLNGYTVDIPKAGPTFTFGSNKWDGYLRLDVPATSTYWHWSGSDEAPQLRRDVGEGDWQVTTRMQLSSHTPDASFVVGLQVYFSATDIFYWGFFRSISSLRMFHSGIGNYFPVTYTDGNTVELRIRKEGNSYYFEYRAEGASSWIVAGDYWSGQQPQAVGLIGNTWNIGNQIVADFDYLRLGGDALRITSTALKSGQAYSAYSDTLIASGGESPYTWSLVNGTLPGGLLLNSNGVLNGTPTQADTVNLTFRVKDSAVPADSTDETLQLKIESLAPVVIVTDTLPAGQVGSPYSATMTGSGGMSPYSWQIVSGVLPNGLSLDQLTGEISGTPSVADTVLLTIRLKDSQVPADSIDKNLQLRIADIPSLVIETSGLPGGSTGVPYSTQLQGAGGVTPYKWYVDADSLPDGIVLDSLSGTFSGTPAEGGDFSFTVTLKDDRSIETTKPFTLTISDQPLLDEEFVSQSLNGYTVDIPKAGPTFTFGTDKWDGYLRLDVPATTTYWHWSGSDQAPQLRRDVGEGDWQITTLMELVTFTPNANFVVGLEVYFSAGDIFYWGFFKGTSALRMFHSGVGNYFPVYYTGGNRVELRIRKAGTDYHFDYRAEGADEWIGAGSYYSAAQPLAVGLIGNTWNVGSQVVADFDYLRLRGDELVITNSSLQSGSEYSAYLDSLTAGGGTPPYSWSLVSGTPPAGITFDPATGTLQGLPTEADTVDLTFRVYDSHVPSDSVDKTFALEIAALPPLSVTSDTLPHGSAYEDYSYQLQAQGGLSPYTWQLVDGTLPGGMSLNSLDGSLSGKPTVPDTTMLTFRVKDAQTPCDSADKSFELQIDPITPLNILTTDLPSGTNNNYYSETLEGEGGISPYKWFISSGSLPSGLTVDSLSGVISGTPSDSGTFAFTVQLEDSLGSFDQQAFSLQIYGSPYLDEEFVHSSLNGYIVDIPTSGPLFSFGSDKWDGYLQLDVPGDAGYNHWETVDDAPQLRRTIEAEDWQVETRIDLSFTEGNSYKVGLLVYYNYDDLYTWGFTDEVTTLSASRSTTGELGTLESYGGGSSVELRIRKIGNTCYFDYRQEGASTWINFTNDSNTLTPIAIGLIAKTASSGNALTAKFDYLRLNEESQAIYADFIADTTQGYVPLTVQFYDSSAGNIDSWEWTFGDGSSPSTAQNPQHTYSDAGVYTVQLTITGEGETDHKIREDYITAEEPPPPPVADFTADPTEAAVPFAVRFFNHTTGSVDQWDWDFGDGSAHSNEKEPYHAYLTPGEYTVTLTATGGGGSDSQTRYMYINALPGESIGDIELYQAQDITFIGGDHTNPYTDVTLTATFNGPGSRTITLEGFWVGDNLYKVRFAPTAVGSWYYSVQSNDPLLDGQTGTLNCISSSSHGFVKVNGYHYFYDDGTPFFRMGDTSWRMYRSKNADYDSLFIPFVDARASQGFNSLYGSIDHIEDPTLNEGGYLWLNDEDRDRLQPSFFQYVDKRVQYMLSQGIMPGIVFTWAQTFIDYTQDQFERFVRYCIARYSAYNVQWIVSGEYTEESVPSEYSYHGDVVEQYDPYEHPISIHPSGGESNSAHYAEFSGWLDYIMQQIRLIPDSVNAKIIEDRSYNILVANDEFGYEGPTDPSSPYYAYNNLTADQVRKRAWAIVLGGGYFTYGNKYTYTGKELIIKLDELNSPGAQYMTYLSDFMNSVKYYNMEPHNEWVSEGNYCLANPDSEYVIYLQNGGSVEVDMSSATQVFFASWYDPKTGNSTDMGHVYGGSVYNLTSPYQNDTVLHFGRIVDPGDTTPPNISNIRIINITQNSATVTWNTDEPSVGQVEWGTDTSYGNLTPLSTVFQNAFRVDLGSLQAQSVYHLRILVKDAKDNQSQSADQWFETEGAAHQLSFTDITQSSGTSGYSANGYGHGVSFADVDKNSRMDLLVSNAVRDLSIPDHLYLNTGSNLFDDQAALRGTSDAGLTHAIVSADFDGDGDLDLFFANMPLNASSPEGRNRLYQNQGNGIFTDITDWAGISTENNGTRGAVAFDIENDGDLDIYAVNWGDPNELYINNGAGQFTREDRGLQGPDENPDVFGQQGVTAVDFDNDGDIDVYVSRRQESTQNAPNWLFVNDGTGNFTEQAGPRGVAVGGRTNGATFVDFDNDGDLDLFVVNFALSGGPIPLLGVFRNAGDGTFVDMSADFDIPVSGYTVLFGDVDNDTDPDMYLIKNDEKEPGATPKLYLNDGAGGLIAGSYPALEMSAVDARGGGYGDIDNDGDIDFYVACKDGQNFLIQNDLQTSNHYIDILCIGSDNNYGGYGAKVTLYVAGHLNDDNYRLGYQQAVSNYGYISQNQTPLHFGLGAHTHCDIKVVLSNGDVVTYSNVQGDQLFEMQPDNPYPLKISTAFLSSGTQGNMYEQDLHAHDGVAPYEWNMQSGSLPTGLSFDPLPARISGTPSESGTFQFTIGVKDSQTPFDSTSHTFELVIAGIESVQITTVSLPSARVNDVYSAQLEADGGVVPYTWSVENGSLPAGLSLDAATGVISGTPSVADTVVVTFKAIDSQATADYDTATFTLRVRPESQIDEEFDTSLDNYVVDIPKAGPSFDLNDRPGFLRLDVPSGETYHHWTGKDDAPQLRRELTLDNWEVETQLELDAYSGNKFIIGLEVYFSETDIFYFGYNFDTNVIKLFRTGEGQFASLYYYGGNTVQLRIRKVNSAYYFEYKAVSESSWSNAVTLTVTETPTAVGLIGNTWYPDVSLVAYFDYLRLVEGSSLPKKNIPVASESQDPALPESFYVYPNYPNPFNNRTNVDIAIPEEGRVTIAIYNFMGQEVKRLINGRKPAGMYRLSWDGSDDMGRPCGSGVYLLRALFSTDSETQRTVRKLTLLK